GGDPGTISEARLGEILTRLRQIKSIEIVRMGTRIPVVCPMRFTREFCKFLAQFHPFWLNTHFNTAKELTPEARQACANIVDAGIPLGNQTVLMRGINDCWHTMKKLSHELVRARVRPYYIYQCDLSEGITHFRVPVSRGIEIMEHLRGHTSGYAVPTYVIDGVGGGGKIPVNPHYLISEGPDYVLLRNYEGRIIKHPVPVDPPYENKCPGCCETPDAEAPLSGHMLQDQARHEGKKVDKTMPWREKKGKQNLQVLG
ncbi:MAG: hypothetical protein JOY51_01570, partial [Nevskia sp.]|nr:hypothetical protein [Nevskia sp.]